MKSLLTPHLYISFWNPFAAKFAWWQQLLGFSCSKFSLMIEEVHDLMAEDVCWLLIR